MHTHILAHGVGGGEEVSHGVEGSDGAVVEEGEGLHPRQDEVFGHLRPQTTHPTQQHGRSPQSVGGG